MRHIAAMTVIITNLSAFNSWNTATGRQSTGYVTYVENAVPFNVPEGGVTIDKVILPLWSEMGVNVVTCSIYETNPDDDRKPTTEPLESVTLEGVMTTNPSGSNVVFDFEEIGHLDADKYWIGVSVPDTGTTQTEVRWYGNDTDDEWYNFPQRNPGHASWPDWYLVQGQQGELIPRPGYRVVGH